MQMAGRRAIDSNSLNGLAHRNEQESPQSCSSGGFRFATWNLTTFLSCYYHMPEQAKCQLKITIIPDPLKITIIPDPDYITGIYLITAACTRTSVTFRN